MLAKPTNDIKITLFTGHEVSEWHTSEVNSPWNKRYGVLSTRPRHEHERQREREEDMR
jgi:hypothetical protein